MNLALNNFASPDYPCESTAHREDGAASPNTVTYDHSVASEKLVAPQLEVGFIQAPEKFFGKFLKVNVAERTADEKEANKAVRMEFNETLHNFFGPVLAEYLYPKEMHDQALQKGSQLTLQQAQKIVNRGIEMCETLAKYCEHYLDDSSEKNLSQADRLDQAMIRYANQQETDASKQSGLINLLPHAAKAVGGGAMAAFAFATMGCLNPTDIFFLLDLLSDKQLSKGIEDFIKARLIQHVERHLESYLQERTESTHPLSREEEARLRHMLKRSTESLNQESVYPTVKSEIIRAEDLSMGGGGDIHNPIEAINYIFLSPLEHISQGSAHSRLFRDGVTAVIEGVKKIEEVASKTETSTQELSKIKKAIATARQQAAIAAEQNDAAAWRDVEDQESVKTDTTSVKKKILLPPPWRRGI